MKTLIKKLRKNVIFPLAFAGIVCGTGCERFAEIIYGMECNKQEKPIKKNIAILTEFYGQPKVQREDSIAIYDLFKSVGKNPKNFYNPDNAEMLKGIEIENDRIIYLNASLIGLEKIPESIERLTKLRTLNLCCNQIETLPESIGNLADLVVFELGYNPIETLPESIKNLSNLRLLDLSNNNSLNQRSKEIVEELEKKGVGILY